MDEQQQWLVDGPKTIDIEGGRSLKVGLVGGQIDVVAHDEPGMRIEVHAVSGPPLKISFAGDAVEINHTQQMWDNWLETFSNFGRPPIRAELSVMVPNNVHLKLGVVSAHVLVSGLHDDSNINTVSGDVVVDSATGTLELNGVSGELVVRNHTGAIAANTVSGDFTATGNLHSVYSNGVSGQALLDIAGTPAVIQINTVSGNSTIRLEPGVPVKYTVSTLSGKMRLDGADVPKVNGVRVGSWGEGEPRLDFQANGVSANVSLLHGAS